LLLSPTTAGGWTSPYDSVATCAPSQRHTIGDRRCRARRAPATRD
jgi:hypothetical protein